METKISVKGKNEDENLIIEADNLLALKSLLPKYQGQIRNNKKVSIFKVLSLT